MAFPVLSVMLFLPILGALLILAIPRDDPKAIRRVGIIFALVVLGLAGFVWFSVMQVDAGRMTVDYLGEDYAWIAAASFDVHYKLAADGLSAPLVFLAALVILLALFYSTRTVEVRVKEYYALFLMLETSLFGIFLSGDLVLFYAFWVLGLVPLLLLVGIWGEEQRERAAIKLFLYNLVGSVALLIAILYVYSQGGTFDVASAAAKRLLTDESQFTAACAVFLAFFFAFAVRLPSFPFHTWLADAHTEGSTAVSVALAGVFLGTGGYGLIRVALPLFPQAFAYFVTEVPVLPVLAVASIVYGALVCLAQWDLKRLIACSSVVQMGFVTLGVCAAAASSGQLGDEATFEAAAAGLGGAAMQLFAHGVVIGALFFLAGVLRRRTGTYDLRAFGGLARQIPHYYGLTLVMGLAALGLPGLIGFWGEFFVFKSTVTFIPVFAFVGALGVIFTAGYTLWKILQHIFLGTLNEGKWGHLEDMASWEKWTVWPLLLITAVLGVYPAPLLDMFNAALVRLLEGMR